MTEFRPLRGLYGYRAFGALMIVMVITLSLISVPQIGPSFDGADKWHHALAYCSLMFWHGLLVRAPRKLLVYALCFVALGLVMEFAQSFTRVRQMDAYDALANTIGVAVGFALARSKLGNLLVWLERRWWR